MKSLVDRPRYMSQLIELRDVNVIKILTGIRRSGKSSLLKLVANSLRESGISEEEIIEIDFSSYKYSSMTVDELYNFVSQRGQGRKIYIFLDEIQTVVGWERAVNAFMVDFDCDIYLTGSNSSLLAGELATFISGRYVLIDVYPLSFIEYLSFLGYELVESPETLKQSRFTILDETGSRVDPQEILTRFLRFGAFPEVATNDLSPKMIENFLEGIYSSVFIRDILDRLETVNSALLGRLIRFLADNIGNRTSVNSIKNTLVSTGMLKNGKVSHATIHNYIEACTNAFLFYPAQRYDIKGKAYLSTLGKYYIADTGIRNYILEEKESDFGFLLENMIFMELKKRGFKVNIGKVGAMEIDFIARNEGKVFYIQVTESLSNPDVFEREIRPLREVRDGYKRLIITREPFIYSKIVDGIEIVDVIEFLLDEDFLK